MRERRASPEPQARLRPNVTLPEKMMKIVWLLLVLLPCDVPAHASTMTDGVRSWEGTFKLSSFTPLFIEGLPPLMVQQYKLEKEGGGVGIVIGWATEKGEMILEPAPRTDDVQPACRDFVVVQDTDGTAHIIVTCESQEKKGGKIIESYRYDGKSIALESRTMWEWKPYDKARWYRLEDGGRQ